MTASRSGATRWARLLADLATPVFLLDGKRRLCFFNQGCTEWTGWTEADLVGQTCHYVTEADATTPAAVLSACAPPPEVWQGCDAVVPYFIPHRTNAPRAGRVQFEPWLDAQGRVIVVYGRLLPPVEATAAPPENPAQWLHAELAALRHQTRLRFGEDSLICRSPAMRRVAAQMSLVKLAAQSLLLTGETGSGKEYLARVLHAHGPYARLAFVPVDCRQTPSSELKRILRQMRDDHRELEALQAGTLFLDQIEFLPGDVQERLLEWLQTRPENRPPRVMAATNGSLLPRVEADEFQRDLHFLLTTAVIELPPLRDRPEDLEFLAQYFLEEENRLREQELSGLHADVLEAFRRYQWPGNVAELRSVVVAAARHAAGTQLLPGDLPLAFRSGAEAQRLGPVPQRPLQPLETVLAEVERHQIQTALTLCRDNLTKAAEALGMSRPKLYRRMEALGLLPGEPQDDAPPAE